MASLIVTAGRSAGEYYPLGHRTTVVGRAENVAFQILDERVSRRHLQIHYEPGEDRYYALDMNSRHGTMVNNQRISTDAPLADGDEIRIGTSALLFTTQDFPDRESALQHFKQVGQRGKTTMPG
jgi:pSer/pThr/pTyr-binding forkhead associated (FHA) protein